MKKACAILLIAVLVMTLFSGCSKTELDENGNIIISKDFDPATTPDYVENILRQYKGEISKCSKSENTGEVGFVSADQKFQMGFVRSFEDGESNSLLVLLPGYSPDSDSFKALAKSTIEKSISELEDISLNKVSVMALGNRSSAFYSAPSAGMPHEVTIYAGAESETVPLEIE